MLAARKHRRKSSPLHLRKGFGREDTKVFLSFLRAWGAFRITGNLSFELCISFTWSRLQSAALSTAVLMIWMLPACARCLPAISAYICPTAPLMVTSRYSLYMLCVFVRDS